MDSPKISGGQNGWTHMVENSLWFCVLNSGERAFGGIAQLVERLVRNEKARGSNPLTSSPEVRGERPFHLMK